MPWLLLFIVALGGAACFGYGRLWGHGRPRGRHGEHGPRRPRHQ